MLRLAPEVLVLEAPTAIINEWKWEDPNILAMQHTSQGSCQIVSGLKNSYTDMFLNDFLSLFKISSDLFVRLLARILCIAAVKFRQIAQVLYDNYGFPHTPNFNNKKPGHLGIRVFEYRYCEAYFFFASESRISVSSATSADGGAGGAGGSAFFRRFANLINWNNMNAMIKKLMTTPIKAP